MERKVRSLLESSGVLPSFAKSLSSLLAAPGVGVDVRDVAVEAGVEGLGVVPLDWLMPWSSGEPGADVFLSLPSMAGRRS